jgi:hypothetical protein
MFTYQNPKILIYKYLHLEQLSKTITTQLNLIITYSYVI